MRQSRILIVEDDRKMADLLRKGLEEEGHSAAVAYDGRRGLEMAQTSMFDIVVLDIMLPGIDGFEIANRLRTAGNQIPILMLTGRDAVSGVVRGLKLGADDYLTKPFSFEALLARLEALARRAPAVPSTRFQVGDLTLDLETREARRGRERIPLNQDGIWHSRVLDEEARPRYYTRCFNRSCLGSRP